MNRQVELTPRAADGRLYKGWVHGGVDARPATADHPERITNAHYIDEEHGAQGFGYPLRSDYGPFAFEGHLFLNVVDDTGIEKAYHLSTSLTDKYGPTWNITSEDNKESSYPVDTTKHQHLAVSERLNFGDILPVFDGRITSIAAVVGDPVDAINLFGSGKATAAIKKFYSAA